MELVIRTIFSTDTANCIYNITLYAIVVWYTDNTHLSYRECMQTVYTLYYRVTVKVKVTIRVG